MYVHSMSFHSDTLMLKLYCTFHLITKRVEINKLIITFHLIHLFVTLCIILCNFKLECIKSSNESDTVYMAKELFYRTCTLFFCNSASIHRFSYTKLWLIQANVEYSRYFLRPYITVKHV